MPEYRKQHSTSSVELQLEAPHEPSDKSQLQAAYEQSNVLQTEAAHESSNVPYNVKASDYEGYL